MKENKLIIIIFGAALICSTILLIWSEYWNYSCVINYLDFLKGHKNFWENILLGIFTSVLIGEVTSVVTYLCLREKLSWEIKRNYHTLIRALHRLEIYQDKGAFEVQIHEVWLASCIYIEEYMPFCSICKRPSVNRKIHDLIREIMLRRIDLEKEEAVVIYNTISKEFQEKMKSIDTYFHNLDLIKVNKMKSKG